MIFPVKLTAGLGIATVALGVALAVVTAQNRTLQVRVRAEDACLRALKGEGPLSIEVACRAEVAAPVQVGRRALTCDEALAAGNAFAAQQACSAPVKRTVAERDTARVERDGAQIQLRRVRTETNAAVSRAEARTRTSAQRKADAQAVIAAAPRLGDGAVVCDAECLRGIDPAPADAGPADAGG